MELQVLRRAAYGCVRVVVELGVGSGVGVGVWECTVGVIMKELPFLKQ